MKVLQKKILSKIVQNLTSRVDKKIYNENVKHYWESSDQFVLSAYVNTIQ